MGQDNWKRVVSSDHFIIRQNAWTFASSFFRAQDMPLVMYNSRGTVGNRRSWKEGGSLGQSRTHWREWICPDTEPSPGPDLREPCFSLWNALTPSLPLFFFHTACLLQSFLLIVFQLRYCGCTGRSRLLALQVNNNNNQLCLQFNCCSPWPVTIQRFAYC